MPVRMVHVGHVWMLVTQANVPVRMGVGLTKWRARLMRMLVMRIVNVRVSVLHGNVLMLVFVNFSQVQPNAECHQQSRDAELDSNNLAEEQNGSSGP